LTCIQQRWTTAMSDKKTLREGEVLAYILANMDDSFECETDFTDRPSMSRSTAFRALSRLDEKDLVVHVGEGRYRIPLPNRVLKNRQPLLRSNARVFQATCLLVKAFDELFPMTVQTLRDDVDRCSQCPERERCFRDEDVECPHQCQMSLISNEIRISSLLLDPEDPEEEKRPVSNEMDEREDPDPDPEPDISSFEEDPEEDPPLPPPQSDRRLDARALLKRSLKESKAAEKAKPPSVKVQVKELKAVWDEGMKGRFGADFRPAPWGGQEHSLAPRMITNNGLELTKKALRLYFKHWDRILEENQWITERTPTFGLFWKFRESLLAAAQGKATVGERASKRTADLWDERYKDCQGWGDSDEEASPAPEGSGAHEPAS